MPALTTPFHQRAMTHHRSRGDRSPDIVVSEGRQPLHALGDHQRAAYPTRGFEDSMETGEMAS